MRILLLTNNLGVGGVETQTVRLARVLALLGHQVRIGYFSTANVYADELDREKIEHHRIRPRPHNYRPWTFYTAASKVAAVCNEFSPDVIHSHLELADVVGQMVATKLCLPHVISFHNTHWWAARNIASYWRIVYRKHWLRQSKPLLVAVSHAAAQAAATALGIAQKNIIVVHNGIDLTQYTSSHWLADSVPPSTWQLICVGRLERVKGQDILIRALASDKLPRHQIRLLLVGNGSARAALEQLADQLGISHMVTFMGTRYDVPALLSESDIYVQTSRSEGLGIALIEALATGLPVVISDLPAMEEVITAYGTTGLGRVVPRDNPESLAGAIKQYMLDPLECRRQALLGRECASRFSIEATVREMERIYAQAINHFPQGTRH